MRGNLCRCRVGVVTFVAIMVSLVVLVPAASYAGVCPNEALDGFRAYLPNCRAYELVSPPFKAGQRNQIDAVSVEGSRLFDLSLGAFGGTEADAGVEGAGFTFARSASRWEAVVTTAPASEFPAQEYFASSTDLSRSLWGLRGPLESIYAENIALQSADGTVSLAGPMLPPGAVGGPPAGGYNLFSNFAFYSGASADLSHVLFSLSGLGALWPGDTTAPGGGNSLYEYVGTNNQVPSLVGVDAQGRLISDCETALGSLEEGDTYNAVSANGDSVYFTARAATQGGACTGSGEGTGPPVDELYARLGQRETVAISEPSVRSCRSCQLAVKSSAEYQGASADGTKAFFLSEQELFAGVVGLNLYEFDFASPEGEKLVLVSRGAPESDVAGMSRVSADGSHVYFVATARLTTEPRGAGCAAELGPAEAAEEELTGEGRCRAKAGGSNLYVFERDASHPSGHVSFVATLSPEDSSDWRAVDRRPVQVTPDGRFVVFQSAADLTAGDVSAQQQVFEYDAQQQTLVRASIGQRGYTSGTINADAHGASITAQRYQGTFRPAAAASGLAVSADGSTVVFESAAALTQDAESAAAVGAESVYAFQSSGGLSGGDVHLISDGRDTHGAQAIGIDASGRDIYFATADQLVPEDRDTQSDIYDARQLGGMTSAPAPATCTGEGCQGEPPGPLGLIAPGSASQAPGANLSPSSPVSHPAIVGLTRAQKLQRALRSCRRGPRRRRAHCEAAARKRYPARSNVKAGSKR
jgi:hypothetical protein